MRHLFYAFLYICALTYADFSPKTALFVPALFALIVFLRYASNTRPFTASPPAPSSLSVGPKTSCVLTTPSGGLIEDVAGAFAQVTGTTGANGTTTGSAPRRQRSLRERAGIDGRLDKLHQPNMSNRSTFLAPSPSVSTSVNAEVCRPVRKADFAEHVRFMSQDSDVRFIEEYQDLSKVGRGQPCTAADMPCNRSKNRFANVLPYDHSRVVLNMIDGLEGSDYINASYIPGYNDRKEYISTQGPLASTSDDFWRMVWEQNSRAIVNLTRCHEKGRDKCDQYWPNDQEPLKFGTIQVALEHETKLPFGTIRELRLSQDGQSRTVTHFHFTAWPDFGVPERPQTLVKFIRAFRAHVPSSPRSNETGPIVVHCSAGVGRSGTMIAIDRILQHLQYHDDVDVYGVVYEMRKERFWMVQTEQQYIFIHQCLLCVLEGREDEDDLSANMFDSNPTSPVIEISHSSPFS